MNKLISSFRFLSIVFAVSGLFVFVLPASAGTATQLKITTVAKTVTAGVCSSGVTVQRRDASGYASVMSTATAVSLSSTSLKFYSNSTCSTQVSAVSISDSYSSKVFYFKGTAAGSKSLTASSYGLASASQTESILAAAPAKLAFKTQPSTDVNYWPINPAVQVKFLDTYGNLTTSATAQVTLTLGNNPTGAVLGCNPALSPVSGVVTFTGLNTSKAGTGYTLIASSTGLPSKSSVLYNTSQGTDMPPAGSCPYASPSPSPSPSPTPTPTPSPSGIAGRIIPSPVYGVTADSIDTLTALVTSLANLRHMPTTRIVFDEWVAASYYVNPVNQIQPVSYVMGELLDSFYVKNYTVDQYKARMTEYLNALGNKVDLWEIGNEINGEWLGDTATVVAKMTGAYDLVKAKGGRTELTLYYNEECWANPANEMFTWTQKNVPAYMKSGLDYVLISYYEDDCNGLQPDWPVVFQKLGAMFPNSKIGFGEVGTINSAKKAEYINRYYQMQITTPGYIGGYFWWYFIQDMVPYTKSLWTTLNNAFL